MIYFPDETASGSWADRTLGFLQYDSQPQKLQAAIEHIFAAATSNITIQGVQDVVAVPLFRILDPKDGRDYVARVEPSVQGGQKMARAFADILLHNNDHPTLTQA